MNFNWRIHLCVTLLLSIRGSDSFLDNLCYFIKYVNCSMDTQDYRCGSDGRTYMSRCDFAQAHCKDSSLTVRHKGVCNPQSTQTTRTNDEEGGLHLILSVICSDIVHIDCSRSSNTTAYCGSDHITYQNICFFEKERCTNEKLRLLHQGRCTE
ncbi:hypothetical protein CHS0354_031666 [Potamilus streckersoni]|uniref:Kazal-like domain-containing protein n=1 Tax=Potamilus streckersoni TaxID=2493646 RepID=A0AAE0TET7_9BIVA|nr:hypothetical protein CHS0354_031666 [Potamilus streckersoni]